MAENEFMDIVMQGSDNESFDGFDLEDLNADEWEELLEIEQEINRKERFIPRSL
jgi:hypothetical protein